MPDQQITSGTVEAINQKIKLIKSKNYGLTNLENFKIRNLLNYYFRSLFFHI
ncbi:transposase [Okeania sp. SIO3I5]|uniref:transposase n=1 Tax=Okeania sp. SIO3I5 TaxID=2607805 RepID=UPI00344918B6